MNQQTSGHTQRFLVVDDHEAVLAGTVPALKAKYPDAQILTAKDRHNAEKILQNYNPNVVVLDLGIPEKPNSPANIEVGIQLLRNLLGSSLAPNIMVLSTNIQPLVRLKPLINSYEGGFAAMDKSMPLEEMLRLIELTLRGSIHLPPQVRSRPEFERKWLQLLQLKFQEGLTDKAIASRMSVSDRTVRNYWVRVQDALGIYDETDKDLQFQIEIEARKVGLID